MRFPIFVMALMLSFGAHAEPAKAESMQPMQHMMAGDDCPTMHKKDNCPTKHKKDDCPTMQKNMEKCRHEGMHAPSAACMYEGKLYSEGAVLKMPDGVYRCASQPTSEEGNSQAVWVPASSKPAKMSGQRFAQ